MAPFLLVTKSSPLSGGLRKKSLREQKHITLVGGSGTKEFPPTTLHLRPKTHFIYYRYVSAGSTLPALSTIGTLVLISTLPALLVLRTSARGHLFWCSVPKPAKPAESEPTQAGEAG